MTIIRDNAYHTDRSVLVLGMFDGLHIGHQVLLRKGLSQAARTGNPLIVCTFDSHPLSLIAPEKAPATLTTLEERAALLEHFHVDALLVQHFDTQTMNTLPEEYIGKLVQRFHPSDVVCGYNFTFGQKGAGTPALLEALGNALHFRTWTVPKITLDGMEVSSTEVRKALADGNVALAARMLNRPYSLQVRQEGGILTFPGKAVPAPGKYRVLAGLKPAVLTVLPNGTGKVSPPISDPSCEIRFLSGIR